VSKLGPSLAALKMCAFTAMLVALIFSDLEKRILPDQFTKGGIEIGLAFALFVPVPDIIAQSLYWLVTRNDLPAWIKPLAESALGAVLPALFLWVGGWLYFKIRHREGLGFGDVKLIAMVGSFLGLRGALFTLIVGSVAGSIISLLYIKLTGRDAATYELPFGTFLGAAALAAAIAPEKFLAP
jgi:leader peptidase (prepilin peptidase)/N-methyltransferase